MRPELTLPRPANLRACIYPKEAETPPAAAVAQIARAWLHEHGLEESARACVCAEKAGPQGSGWSVKSVLALLHVVQLHDSNHQNLYREVESFSTLTLGWIFLVLSKLPRSLDFLGPIGFVRPPGKLIGRRRLWSKEI